MNYYVSILKKDTKICYYRICLLITVCNLSFAESPQYNAANTICDLLFGQVMTANEFHARKTDVEKWIVLQNRHLQK